jgi:hypothetical protein
VWALHGLSPAALNVGPTSRSAGDLVQTISQTGETVTLATTAAPDTFTGNAGQMIEELATLHGLTSTLTVTPTSRSAGPIAQALATASGITTVTRQ